MTTANAEADRAFLDFIAANPAVLRIFVEVAREKLATCRARGWAAKIGAKYVWEEMRWRLKVETNDDDYRLNNTYLSRLVRHAVRGYPDLAGAFDTRKLKVAPGELALDS